MATILNFPSRFALLAKAWSFPTTSQEITKALDLTKDVLGKYANGQSFTLRNPSSTQTLIEKLATHLSDTGELNKHNLTRAAFITAFSQYDDIEFLRLIMPSAPVPSSVLSAQRSDVQTLIGKMAGYSLMYRLGVEERREAITATEHRVKLVPVLRRIPIRITDTDANFLSYEDQYNWYSNSFEPASAHGFVFYTRSSVCIFAEDLDHKQDADLFMMQVNVNLADKDEPLRDGVIVMAGDSGSPTAGKVILRKIDDHECENLDWDDFVKAGEKKIYIQDNDRDGIFELEDTDEDNVEMLGDTKLGTWKYTDYANALQIRNFKVHIAMGTGQM